MKRLALDLSGFGGGYEHHCQLLFQAGLDVLAKNPELAARENDSGHYSQELIDKLQDLMIEKVKEENDRVGTTGAQMSVATSAALYVHTHGWPNWIREIAKADRLGDLYMWDGTAGSCPKEHPAIQKGAQMLKEEPL